MEDYKTKYEKAIEQAKKELQACGSLDCDAARQIFRFFPELKKSDDEKIRKTLKSFFDSEISDYGNVEWRNGIRYGEIVSWLEKQGEQKPQGNSALEAWKDMRLEVYQQASGNRHEPNCTDESTKMFSLTNIDEILEKITEKQGEQSKQHLYDIIIALWNLLDKIDTFSDLQIDDTNSDNPFRKIEHIAQERHKFVKSDGYNLYIKGEQTTDFKQIEQEYPLTPDECIKSAWSEEDENMFDAIIADIQFTQKAHTHDVNQVVYEREIDWLKSIKERVQAQLKQEWTGYDEKAYEIALLDIDKSPSITKNDTIDWLKSLKERLKGE